MSITGRGYTYNLPNYVGELFGQSPETTPFLSAIGGLSGGERADGKIRAKWQTYSLRAPSIRTRVEGADAPDGESRKRYPVANTLQIIQETIDLSYSKMANNAIDKATPDGNPVQDELSWQIEKALLQVAKDVNYSMINGDENFPGYGESDAASKRQMDGIRNAIVTNVNDAENSELTADMVLDLVQTVYDAGGIEQVETATLLCNSSVKRRLSKVLLTDRNTDPDSRTVGGVNLQTIETDFGRLNIMMDRSMATDELVLVSLEQCAPVFLEIPGKGYLFEEPLARTGSAERYQIYGEATLKYGNEKSHGKLININVGS